MFGDDFSPNMQLHIGGNISISKGGVQIAIHVTGDHKFEAEYILRVMPGLFQNGCHENFILVI